MKILRKFIILVLFLLPLLAYQGCKKQPKCGCGKDVIFELKQSQCVVTSLSEGFISFISDMNPAATFYFCNPDEWADTLSTMSSSNYLLISGKAYYECTYLLNSGNYYGQIPPVYQVEVTSVEEDNYGK
jgi:hypothetical protein